MPVCVILYRLTETFVAVLLIVRYGISPKCSQSQPQKIVKKSSQESVLREKMCSSAYTCPIRHFRLKRKGGETAGGKVTVRISLHCTVCTYLAAAMLAGQRNQLQCRKLLVCPTFFFKKRKTNRQLKKTFSQHSALGYLRRKREGGVWGTKL